MALYIGTNYSPHDWTREQWKKDIALMKEAGFTTVRLGHLCWDCYEPDDGVYTFEWFDEVMDLFAEAGINVFLDISTRPAPVWVHKICPGCNIYGKSGTVQQSLRRYMEDVADEAYQYYALRFAKILVNRYKSHPALLAFGLCNELGDGYISHSEMARQRFIQWLKKKYKTVENLNEAWATRRWCRRVNSFDEVWLPENEIDVGAPEAWLDMKRFWSDGIAQFMIKLKNVVEENAPGIPHSSNHFAGKLDLGFDYMKYYPEIVDYPGYGNYTGYSVHDKYMAKSAEGMQRMAETGKPMWCLEFQVGSRGMQFGRQGALRMMLLLSLLNRSQMALGWLWRTMLAGEEQFIYGMLGHDGIPTENYEEYKRAAADYKKLEQYAFPYVPKPEIAMSYSYESYWLCDRDRDLFRKNYRSSLTAVREVFFEKNMEYNVVDLHRIQNEYKLLIVPNHFLLDEEEAAAIRGFVEAGGTVIMTGLSGVADKNGKIYGTPRPGGLTDVFGVRCAGFYRASDAWRYGEDTYESAKRGKYGETLYVRRGEECFPVSADYYEVLELNGAEAYAQFEGKELCSVSVNHYGRGTAFYTATELCPELLSWLVGKVSETLGLKPDVRVPQGIQARKIAENQYYFVNVTSEKITIPLEQPGRGVLSEKNFDTELELNGYDAELVITE